MSRNRNVRDWQLLKCQYMTGSESIRELAARANVPASTLARRARREQWQLSRENYQKRREQGLLSSERDTRRERFLSLADVLSDRLGEALEQMDATDTQTVRHLTAVLKDLKDMLSIKSELDLREQRAKINNLEHGGEKNDADALHIVLEGELQQWAQ